MNRCEAPNCKMRTYAPTAEQLKMAKNNYVISFHKFPDDPDKRQSWISAAKKPSWKPPMFNSSLCSLHFRDDCFDDNNELYDHAVPSIFFDDFGSHMREIVKKLGMECKLDDDDPSKPSKGFENTVNSSLESNKSCTSPGTDEDDVVQCEEVVLYEESPKKLGIENISIPELDETTSISTKNNDENSPVLMPELGITKINLSNIVDIKIDNLTNCGIIENTSKSKSNDGNDTVGIKQIKTQKDLNKLKVTSCNTLSKDNSVGLSKALPSNISPVPVTRSPSAPFSVKSSVQRSNFASDTPTIDILRYKPTALSSALQRLSPSKNLTKSPLISSPVSLPNKSAAVSSPGSSSSCLATPGSTPSSRSTTPLSTSSSRSTTPVSTSTNSSTKSTFTPSQSSESTNATSSISFASTIKATPSSSTSTTSKSTTTSNVPAASNSSNARGKSASSETGHCPNSFSVMGPETKSLVLQLLNIVKMANASDENRFKSGPTINSYLVTSKCPDTDSSELCEILPSSSVILNVANYVKAIKEESFVKPDNVNIICGSPAIFLLKNVTVEECDPNMNCVYVITSENLLPHLYQMKIKSDISTKSAPQQSTKTSNTAMMIIQRPLQVADLVSSANPKAVMPIQNKLRGVSNTTTTKLNTTPKFMPTAGNSANKSASNSISCPGPKPRSTNSVSYSDAAKSSENDSIQHSFLAKPNTSNLNAYTSAAKPQTNTFGAVVSKPRVSSLTSRSPAAEPPTNVSVSGTNLVKSSTIDLISNTSTAEPSTNTSIFDIPSVEPPINDHFPSAAKKLPSNSSICYNYLTKPPAKASVSSAVPAKPLVTASVSHAAVTKSPVNSTNSYPFKSSLQVSCSLVTPAKSSVNTSISGSRETLYKPSSAPLTNSTSLQSKNATYKNLSITPTYVQTATTSSCVITAPLTSTSISKTISTSPDTPIAQVVPSPLKSPASTPPVARLGVQPGSINMYSKSQPTFIVSGKDGTPMRISTTPASNRTTLSKSFSVPHQMPSKRQPSTVVPTASSYTFQSIQPTAFDTNLKTSEVLVTYDYFASTPKQSTSLNSTTKQTTPAISISGQSTVIPPLKRKWGEIDEDDDDDDDDDDDPFFANCNDEEYDKEYVEQQRKEISKCEANILQKEREIHNLKRRVQNLRKRLNSVKDPHDTKTDEQLVEEILSKYIDSDGIQFFIGQMKVAGKTYTQFRWSEDDKLFALGLLYRNPVEYNVLFQKYTLPSDKTLNKFVNRVKKAEMEDGKGTSRK